MTINHIVFYGSLKKGESTPVHDTIAASFKYIGECIIPGQLYDLERIPALKRGTRPIRGELYEVLDDGALPTLDQYEAIDNVDPTAPGYTRSSIRVLKPQELDAWVYYYDGDVSKRRLIEENHWH